MLYSSEPMAYAYHPGQMNPDSGQALLKFPKHIFETRKDIPLQQNDFEQVYWSLNSFQIWRKNETKLKTYPRT